jgi:hypothetical protein
MASFTLAPFRSRSWLWKDPRTVRGLKHAPEQIVKVLQQIEASLASSNTQMPAPNKQGHRCLPCPTRANFWMNQCYGRKSSLSISIIR